MSEPAVFVWRLTPVASADDPSWQGRRIWSELEIVAAGAGQAIFLAARYDEEQAGHDTAASQDRQQLRSGFEDERLYRVDRLETPPPTGAAPGDVLRATLLGPASSGR